MFRLQWTKTWEWTSWIRWTLMAQISKVTIPKLVQISILIFAGKVANFYQWMISPMLLKMWFLLTWIDSTTLVAWDRGIFLSRAVTFTTSPAPFPCHFSFIQIFLTWLRAVWHDARRSPSSRWSEVQGVWEWPSLLRKEGRSFPTS